MYTLVHLDKKSRAELLEKITPIMPRPTRLRKLAHIGFTVKNEKKEKYLYNSGSHGELSDVMYEKFLAGASSEELEDGEVIRVGVERGKGKEPLALYHEPKYPIWNVKGLCYLAALKVGAIKMFMWRKNITLKELVTFSKNFRCENTFYITEEGKDRLHLSLRMPHNRNFKSGGWRLLEALAKEKPNARIGGEGKKDDDVPMFNGTNWHEFSFRFKAKMMSKGLWHIIEYGNQEHIWNQEKRTRDVVKKDEKGKETEVPEEYWHDLDTKNPKYLEHEEHNVKALGLLSLKLPSNMSTMFRSTAFATWRELVNNYDSPGAAGVFAIFQKIIRFKLPADKNPATEATVLLELVARLNEKGIRLADNIVSMIFLSALPAGWDNLATTILLGIDTHNVKLPEVLHSLQTEWERRDANKRNQGMYVARTNIHKNNGQKPQWKGRNPQQNAQASSSAQPWQNVQHKNKKPHVKKPYQPPQNKQPFNPNQLQKGPNWAKNRANREKRHLAAAIREGKAPVDSFEKANIPKFAAMAIIDKPSSSINGCYEGPIKQEEMDIDLNEENFPILSRSNAPSPSTKLGKHTLSDPLTADNLASHTVASQTQTTWDDDYEMVTDHDHKHPNPGGYCRCCGSEEPAHDSVHSGLSSILGHSDKENFPPEEKRVFFDIDKEWKSRQVTSLSEQKAEKERSKNFLDKYWYDGKRNEDEVSLGYDDDYMRYGFDSFSLNKANENLAKYNKSNIMIEYHHDYNNSCIKYTECNMGHNSNYTMDHARHGLLCHIQCSGLYCNNHVCDDVYTITSSSEEERSTRRINVAVKSYKSENENESYWLLDGGASMHITPHLSDFSEYREYQAPVRVKTANKNAEAEILGEGKVYIQNQIGDIKQEMMIETCYMPNGEGRLFSTGSLKQSGFVESSDKNNTKLYLNGKLEIIGYPIHQNECTHWIKTKIVHKHAYSMYGFDKTNLWHDRMAHPSQKVLTHLRGNVIGSDPIKVTNLNNICEGCVQGKMHARTYEISENRATEKLELIHGDLMEMPIESYHWYKWCLVLLDDYTSFVTVFLLRSKSETMQHMKHYIDMIETALGHKRPRRIMKFRSDRGGEFKSHEFELYIKTRRIIHEFSAPYVHQQNGRAERINRTLREKAESMRHHAGLPNLWWEFAIETATHVYNRTPLERTLWKTPFQNFFGIIPKVDYFRTFGCLAWVWTPEELRTNKLEPRCQPMTFIGYDRSKNWVFM
jgi:hypothetical protein